ncbi:flagellar hook-length control protein FliK [Curtobacterium sp. PsM8]|uniref:flagellar hook-length control protein FliK n=1 Tax=Curtobacterium sp. PsM8 TaxID=3030532 RepID=UPI00263B6A2C|nr:flagellar hook-length control protein FliK [Curtobacterium sp. PsM8]MDN4648655.1 flagellar hook-length control protein FliK [Curtobacterium sp. PsM8]
MNGLLTGAPPAPVPAVMRPRGAGERSGAAEARSGAEFGAALSAVSGAGQRDRGRPEPTRDDSTPSATVMSPTGSAAGLVTPTTGNPGAAATGAATDDDDAVTSDAATTEPVAQSVANVLTPGVSAALAATGTGTVQGVVGQDPAAGTLATPAATATTGDDATAETPDPTAVAGTGTPTPALPNPALSNPALSNAALLNTVSLVAAAMSTAPAAPTASSSATASAASSTAPAAGVVGTPATAPTGAALASGATAAAQPTAPAGRPTVAAAAAAATATASEQHPAVQHTPAALPGAQSAAATPATAATPAGHVPTAAGADQGGASLPAGPGTVDAPVDAPVVLAVPATAAPVSSTPTAAPSAPTLPAAPQPVAQQLARPLFTLAHAGPGEHVLTVQLTPEALGPVTVRAHVTGHGMHVELFAASDVGRDAVRQILPDLRRDSGGSTTLDLSAQNHPADAGADGRDRAAADTAGRDGTGRETDHPADREARPGPATTLPSAPTTVRTAGLDVLA